MHETARPDDESGFTLVEALIAIVVLVFGLLAITNLMIIGASSNTVANQSSATTALASQQLEQLKAVPFGTLNAATGGDITTDVTNFFRIDKIDGVGPIDTRWQVTSVNSQTLFIQVRSEPLARVLAPRARAEFTTFRTCTAQPMGCPAP
jgi:Tfp pilus assembly protein PilV